MAVKYTQNKLPKITISGLVLDDLKEVTTTLNSYGGTSSIVAKSIPEGLKELFIGKISRKQFILEERLEGSDGLGRTVTTEAYAQSGSIQYRLTEDGDAALYQIVINFVMSLDEE